MNRYHPDISLDHRSVLAHIVVCCCIAAGALALPATAQEAPTVDNGSQPAEGLSILTPVELWRAGGEDDEIFFGSVATIRTDAAGNFYVLDGQLSQVHVYSPTGELLRTVGGEGDGPGETRRPGDMFLTPDGTICVLQGFPGKIVKLAPDGTPAGDSTYSVGEGGGQFTVLVRGMAAGSDMILVGIRMSFAGAGQSNQQYFLARCGADGRQKVSLYEKANVLDFSNMHMDELANDFVWSRAAVGGDGRVYCAPGRNDYAVNVYAPDGKVEKIIRREFEAPERNDKERRLARQVMEAIGANYPSPPVEITIEDTQPDITQMTVARDGRLWIQTCRGDRDVPDGTWIVLDVFDPEGRFEKQVALTGDHDAARDALFLTDNGKALVVVGSLDAFLNQQGAAGEADETDEAEPLEIICYRLDLN